MNKVEFNSGGRICECHFPPLASPEATVQSMLDWSMYVVGADLVSIQTDVPFDPTGVTAYNTIPVIVCELRGGLLYKEHTIR
jgi:hypothetical protein